MGGIVATEHVRRFSVGCCSTPALEECERGGEQDAGREVFDDEWALVSKSISRRVTNNAITSYLVEGVTRGTSEVGSVGHQADHQVADEK